MAVKIEDKITGLTHEKEGNISVGDDMHGATSIGTKRSNQEDGVLLAVHPYNKDFKMLVVADGMGGEECGEYASDILINEFSKWFRELDSSYYENIEILRNEVQSQIEKIAKKVNEFNRWAGTTYCSAIVGKDKTLMSNVGDSRAFIVKNGHLEDVSYEDSIVQEMYEDGGIFVKEAKRFHNYSAGITQSVGEKIPPKIHSLIMKNDDYDTIILTSDGVTDCLDDEDIIAICKKTDPKELAKVLVEKANTHDSVMSKELKDKIIPEWMIEDGIADEEMERYHTFIPAGKDNATAATYSKDER